MLFTHITAKRNMFNVPSGDTDHSQAENEGKSFSKALEEEACRWKDYAAKQSNTQNRKYLTV